MRVTIKSCVVNTGNGALGFYKGKLQWRVVVLTLLAGGELVWSDGRTCKGPHHHSDTAQNRKWKVLVELRIPLPDLFISQGPGGLGND